MHFNQVDMNKKCSVVCLKIIIVCETSIYSNFISFCSFLSLSECSYFHLRYGTLDSYSIHHCLSQRNRLKKFQIEVLKVHIQFSYVRLWKNQRHSFKNRCKINKLQCVRQLRCRSIQWMTNYKIEKLRKIRVFNGRRWALTLQLI